jgi:hypothetical protein
VTGERTASLRVALDPQGSRWRYRLSLSDSPECSDVAGPSQSAVARLFEELRRDSYLAPEERARFFRQLPQQFMPPQLVAAIRDWASSNPEAATLAVCSEREEPVLPWPELLAANGLFPPEVVTVHVRADLGGNASNRRPEPVRRHLLAAGWTRLDNSPVPGIDRELRELPAKLGAELKVSVLSDPNAEALLGAVRTEGLGILHLSPPGLVLQGNSAVLPVTGDSGEIGQVSADEMIGALKAHNAPLLLVVNACHAVYPWCIDLVRGPVVAAVGWPALISDNVAADFSLFLYQRMLEGSSVVEALRSFARATVVGRNRGVVQPLPVLVCSAMDWLVWSPLPRPSSGIQADPDTLSPAVPPMQATAAPDAQGAKEPTASRMSLMTVGPLTPTGASGSRLADDWIRVEFQPREFINPALLVNGVAPIEFIRIESSSRQTVRLSIDCDTGVSTSAYRQTLGLDAGVYPCQADAIYFPALHELIDRRVRRRRIVFTLTITSVDSDRHPDVTRRVELTKSALWMGAEEWLDRPEAWRYIPAFVNPFDTAVATLVDRAVSVLRTLGAPDDNFDAYQGCARDEGRASLQMQAVFQTVRDAPYSMRYASPLGSPVYDGRDHSAGQIVRRHTEVLERRLGTCHDLSVLLAAAAEYIGILPLVVLVRGHTFVGFWRSDRAQIEYWRKNVTSATERPCTIPDGEKLLQLVDKDDVALIEAVDVCRPRSYLDSGLAARKRLADAVEDPLGSFHVAIDIREARRAGIQPV